jgi:hypothetical protein
LQTELRHMGVGSFRTGFEDVKVHIEPTPNGGNVEWRLALSVA